MRHDGFPTHFAVQDDEAGNDTHPSLISVGSTAGPSLWCTFFGMLWLNTAFLAALILYPRYPQAEIKSAPAIAGWVAGLGLTAWLACCSRISIHDMVIQLNLKEQLFLLLLTLIVFVLPVLTRNSHIIPDGFLWVAPILILFAVQPHLARRLLAWNLLGVWFAAFHVHHGVALLILLGFGVSWLMALGAHHFAFTGDPHGLSGWWPLRKVIGNALIASIPATLAGALACWLWPESKGQPTHPQFSASAGAGHHPRLMLERLDTADLLEILWRGLLCLFFTAVMLILLVYLRRLLFKGKRQKLNPEEILPGQVMQLEYRAMQAAPARPELIGLRGKIVKLWGRWAFAMERDGYGRLSGETAAEYAQRLAREYPQAAPPAAMTDLLERAHYSKEELSPADLEAMRQYTAKYSPASEERRK